jgi:D-ala-D-ala dipeptidase
LKSVMERYGFKNLEEEWWHFTLKNEPYPDKYFDFKVGGDHHQRGFTVAEVEEIIRNGKWEPAELGRMECRKTFAFSREWNERVYATKEVRPIFVEEADENRSCYGLYLLLMTGDIT